MTKTLLIIAHMPSKNTTALAHHVVKGAQHEDIEGVNVKLLSPFDARAEDVLEADGVIFGTTENLGYMSGALKDFFDRSFYGLLDQTNALPYALYIRAGQDGTGTKRAVEAIVSNGLRWKPICDPVICKGEWTEGFLIQAEELGTLMSAGLEAGIF